MSGYNGYSKSNNAVDAESEGRFPMTTAKQIVAEKTGVTKVMAEHVLKKLHSGEWHHTSKMYNCVDYYDTRTAIHAIEFAQNAGLELNNSFFKTVWAWGLNDVDSWNEFLEKGENALSGEMQTRVERIAEFIEAVKGGKWM